MYFFLTRNKRGEFPTDALRRAQQSLTNAGQQGVSSQHIGMGTSSAFGSNISSLPQSQRNKKNNRVPYNQLTQLVEMVMKREQALQEAQGVATEQNRQQMDATMNGEISIDQPPIDPSFVVPPSQLPPQPTLPAAEKEEEEVVSIFKDPSNIVTREWKVRFAEQFKSDGTPVTDPRVPGAVFCQSWKESRVCYCQYRCKDQSVVENYIVVETFRNKICFQWCTRIIRYSSGFRKYLIQFYDPQDEDVVLEHGSEEYEKMLEHLAEACPWLQLAWPKDTPFHWDDEEDNDRPAKRRKTDKDDNDAAEDDVLVMRANGQLQTPEEFMTANESGQLIEEDWKHGIPYRGI